MSKANSSGKLPKKSKKKIRKLIEKKLSIALVDYKIAVGEKKFESRINDIAKLLRDDILKAQSKTEKKLEKPHLE